MNRRTFLSQTGAGAGLIGLNSVLADDGDLPVVYIIPLPRSG